MAGIRTSTVSFRWFAILKFSIVLGAAAPLDQWQSPNPLPQANLLIAVCYADHVWVAVGSNGTIITSPDGMKWTLRDSGVTSTVWGVSYGSGQWVAPAFDPSQSASVFLTSPDGVGWTKRNSGEKFGLYAIGFGNGQWVAGGANGKVYTSSDGSAWTSRDSGGSAQFSGISYGNGLWVAVGTFFRETAGAVMTSPDGINWMPRTTGIPNDYLSAISYANGQWVAAGAYVIATSRDGINWTARRTSSVVDPCFGIAYGDGQWVVVGYGGKILSSADGINWIPRISGTKSRLFGVGYGNGRWVAVGDGGSIMVSSPVESAPELSISREGKNAFVAWPADAAGYVLESTTSLNPPQSWTAISKTPAIANSQKTISDSLSPPARFYRLRRD